MIVIIPARKGSKRCPGKNIRPFNDEPNIVDLTLGHAHWIECCPRVLTTDYSLKELDMEWAGIQDFYFRERPPELCGEGVTSEDVVEDALNWYTRDIRIEPDYPESFVLLQPTSPIRSQETLTKAKARFERGDISALVSVNPAYQPNGSFYFCKTGTFLMERTLYPRGTHLWVCSWEESVDINHPYEFRIAEAVARGDIHGIAPSIGSVARRE